MAPTTRKLVRLVVEQPEETFGVMDMMLAKKRSPDRRRWLEKKGDQAELVRAAAEAESSTDKAAASMVNGDVA